VPLCPPQIPHDPNYDRIRVAALGSRRRNAWAMLGADSWRNCASDLTIYWQQLPSLCRVIKRSIFIGFSWGHNTALFLTDILHNVWGLRFSRWWLWRVISSVMPCSLVGIYWRFGIKYCLYRQRQRVSQASRVNSRVYDLLLACMTYIWTLRNVGKRPSYYTASYSKR
jgi:hypothetical protein